jgi:deoxyuridine 5'-triphosphate nucleotidohydrolase
MHVRLHGERPQKLTNHATVGTFLGCTVTNKNIIYYDINSKGIETATHIVYNEANITVSQPDRSQASNTLIEMGYCTENAPLPQPQPTSTDQTPIYPSTISAKHDFTSTPTPCPLTNATFIQMLHHDIPIPTQATVQSMGYDVYFPQQYTLEPRSTTKIPLGLIIKPPKNTYVQLMPRSSLALKGITVYGGVNNPDYRGEVNAIIHNASSHSYMLHSGEWLIQMIF